MPTEELLVAEDRDAHERSLLHQVPRTPQQHADPHEKGHAAVWGGLHGKSKGRPGADSVYKGGRSHRLLQPIAVPLHVSPFPALECAPSSDSTHQ